MSQQTTETVVVACRNVAEEKAVAMGNAGVANRAADYAALQFEVVSANCFTAVNPNGVEIDLADMVMDQVAARLALDLNPHRDGGGKQTVYWHGL
jgi:hypothetical protein